MRVHTIAAGLLTLCAAVAFAAARSGINDPAESQQQGSNVQAGKDMVKLAVKTTPNADPNLTSHEFTICWSQCPDEGSVFKITAGSKTITVTAGNPGGGVSAGADVKLSGSAGSNYYNYTQGPPCCLKFSFTSQDLGIEIGASEFDFKAEDEGEGGDKVPDSGSGSHGW